VRRVCPQCRINGPYNGPPIANLERRTCRGLSWLAVVVMVRSPPDLRPSHAQPLPKRAAAAALNFAFISSSDPKDLSAPDRENAAYLPLLAKPSFPAEFAGAFWSAEAD